MRDPWGVGGKPPVKQKPSPRPPAALSQPQARPAQPRPKPSYTGPEAHTKLLYGQPGYTPVATGAPRHKVAPKPPSEEDLIFRNIVKAIGPEIVKHASNPRVAALQSVLGGATGVPAIVHTIRSGKGVGASAAAAATFLPVGKLGRAAETLAKIVGRGKKVEEAVKAAEPAAKAARPVVAPATKTAAKAAPATQRIEMTREQAAKRLAKLNATYDSLLEKIAPEVNPYAKAQTGPKLASGAREAEAGTAAGETRARNTMRGRQAKGMKPATGKSAPEGTGGTGKQTIKTVNQEVLGLAEKKLDELIAKHPDHPVFKQAAALIAERDSLQAALNAHAEAGMLGGPVPKLPSLEVPVPGTAPMLPQERPGNLPGWTPQGQLFPRASSPGRYTPAPPAPRPRVFKVARDEVTGTSNPVNALKDYHTLMPMDGEHLYHSTSAEQFAKIRKEGLKPGRVRKGETTGVYFAEDGASVISLRPANARAGDVILRVRRADVPTETTDMFKPGSGFAEHVSRNPVAPANLEYLGADNQWHSVTEPVFLGEPKPAIEGTPLSPQGEMFQAHQPVTPRDVARANPLQGIPKLRPGVETPETGGQLGRILREQLPLQKSERVLMDQSFSVQRGQRFAAFNQRLQANPTLAGFQSAMGELKGPLEKRTLPGLNEIETDTLVRHVAFFPNLLPGQKVRTIQAVQKMLEGQILQPSEIKAMEQVFGRVVVGHLSELSRGRRLKLRLLDAFNIPRSIMASFDVSAPFRQGLVAAATHPVIFSKNLGPMFKSLVSQTKYEEYLAKIHASPNWKRMEGRVAFTEVGRDLSKREEQFTSRMAETITGGKYSFVRASGRAYTGFLDLMRADLFDTLHAHAMRLDPERNPDDPKFLDDLARLVNDMTGRGQLPGALKNHAVTLNTLFFSPRLLQSRINLLASPVSYARADPFVRREALKTVAETAGVLGTILGFATWAGAKIVTDPRSADFAKIKVGNTHIDIAGGFQQVIRQAAQQVTQSTVSASGKVIPFGGEGPGKVTSWDTFFRFVRSKAAPIPSLAVDLTQRQTFSGAPVTPQEAVLSRVTPLGIQDAITTGQISHSIPAGLGAFGLSAVGVGVQSYRPRKKKGGQADPWNVGGGGGPDPWSVSP